MRKRLAKLPSPAMTLAFVALLAALSGTAVALPGTNSVTGGDIRNNSVNTQDIRNSGVRGRDIRKDTVTGDDVAEGSLGTVPRADLANQARTANTAGSARVANSAGNASAVDGASIADIDFRAATGAPDTVIFDQGGLRLVANCLLDDIELRAINTTAAVGSLYVDGIDSGDAPDYEAFDEFDPGAANEIAIDFYPNDTSTNQRVHFAAQGGANVTAHIHYEENARVSPGQTGCALTGYAVIS